MDYVLNERARDALEKRQISVVSMEHALTHPEVTVADPVGSDLKHRLAVIAEFGNCVLRAIINDKEKPPLAVTVFFDQKGTVP